MNSVLVQRATQLRRGGHQDLDHLGLRIGVVFEPLGRDLAQVLDRRAHHRRNARPAAFVFLALGAPAHPGHALAHGAEPFQHGVDEVAVLLEMRAPLGGDGVEPLGALGLGGEVAHLLEIGERRIDDARAG